MKPKIPALMRRTLFYGLPPIALLCLATVAATRPVDANSKEGIRAAVSWVDAHRNALPTAMRDLEAMPYIYRRAIMYALPIETQGALWREHWTAFVTPANERTDLQRRIVSGLKHPLTAAQNEFLLGVIAEVPSIYTSALTADERAAKGQTLCTKAKAVFPDRSDGPLVMKTFGGYDETYLWPTTTTGEPMRISRSSAAWSIAAPVRSVAVRIGLVPKPAVSMCFCPQTYYCDCGGNLCVQSWPACEPATIICDCGGLMVCDGGKCAS